MAKTNFQFEKRQKELEKKRKNEEKLKRKLNKGAAPSEEAHTEENTEPANAGLPMSDPSTPA